MEFTAEKRVRFNEDTQTMEVDFSDLQMRSAADVDAIYDAVQTALTQSSHEQWYFLINYKNCDIAMSARPAHSRRGSRMNFAHSLGSVRYDANKAMREQISQRPNSGDGSANFYSSREDAVAEIASMQKRDPDARSHGKLAPSKYTVDDFQPRLSFDENIQVMDVDFSNFSFDNSSDVNGFYDFAEQEIGKSGKKWFFLVNYDQCKISMRAWVAFAQRGRRINIASSLGSVRYDATPEAEAEIRAQAETADFKPNIRKSRQEALQKIEELKKAVV